MKPNSTALSGRLLASEGTLFRVSWSCGWILHVSLTLWYNEFEWVIIKSMVGVKARPFLNRTQTLFPSLKARWAKSHEFTWLLPGPLWVFWYTILLLPSENPNSASTGWCKVKTLNSIRMLRIPSIIQLSCALKTRGEFAACIWILA